MPFVLGSNFHTGVKDSDKQSLKKHRFQGLIDKQEKERKRGIPDPGANEKKLPKKVRAQHPVSRGEAGSTRLPLYTFVPQTARGHTRTRKEVVNDEQRAQTARVPPKGVDAEALPEERGHQDSHTQHLAKTLANEHHVLSPEELEAKRVEAEKEFEVQHRPPSPVVKVEKVHHPVYVESQMDPVSEFPYTKPSTASTYTDKSSLGVAPRMKKHIISGQNGGDGMPLEYMSQSAALYSTANFDQEDVQEDVEMSARHLMSLLLEVMRDVRQHTNKLNFNRRKDLLEFLLTTTGDEARERLALKELLTGESENSNRPWRPRTTGDPKVDQAIKDGDVEMEDIISKLSPFVSVRRSTAKAKAVAFGTHFMPKDGERMPLRAPEEEGEEEMEATNPGFDSEKTRSIIGMMQPTSHRQKLIRDAAKMYRNAKGLTKRNKYFKGSRKELDDPDVWAREAERQANLDKSIAMQSTLRRIGQKIQDFEVETGVVRDARTIKNEALASLLAGETPEAQNPDDQHRVVMALLNGLGFRGSQAQDALTEIEEWLKSRRLEVDYDFSLLRDIEMRHKNNELEMETLETSLNKQVTLLREERLSTEKQLSMAEKTRIESLQLADAARKKYDEAEKRVIEADKKIDAIVKKNAMIEAKNQKLREKTEQQQAQISNQQVQIQKLMEQLEVYRKKDLDHQASKVMQTWEAFKSRAEMEARDRARKEAEEEIEKALASLREELAAAIAEKEKYRAENELAKLTLEREREEVKRLNARVKELEESLAEMEKRIPAAVDAVDAVETDEKEVQCTIIEGGVTVVDIDRKQLERDASDLLMGGMIRRKTTDAVVSKPPSKPIDGFMDADESDLHKSTMKDIEDQSNIVETQSARVKAGLGSRLKKDLVEATDPSHVATPIDVEKELESNEQRVDPVGHRALDPETPQQEMPPATDDGTEVTTANRVGEGDDDESEFDLEKPSQEEVENSGWKNMKKMGKEVRAKVAKPKNEKDLKTPIKKLKKTTEVVQEAHLVPDKKNDDDTPTRVRVLSTASNLSTEEPTDETETTSFSESATRPTTADSDAGAFQAARSKKSPKKTPLKGQEGWLKKASEKSGSSSLPKSPSSRKLSRRSSRGSVKSTGSGKGDDDTVPKAALRSRRHSISTPEKPAIMKQSSLAYLVPGGTWDMNDAQVPENELRNSVRAEIEESMKEELKEKVLSEMRVAEKIEIARKLKELEEQAAKDLEKRLEEAAKNNEAELERMREDAREEMKNEYTSVMTDLGDQIEELLDVINEKEKEEKFFKERIEILTRRLIAAENKSNPKTKTEIEHLVKREMKQLTQEKENLVAKLLSPRAMARANSGGMEDRNEILARTAQRIKNALGTTDVSSEPEKAEDAGESEMTQPSGEGEEENLKQEPVEEQDDNDADSDPAKEPEKEEVKDELPEKEEEAVGEKELLQKKLRKMNKAETMKLIRTVGQQVGKDVVKGMGNLSKDEQRALLMQYTGILSMEIAELKKTIDELKAAEDKRLIMAEEAEEQKKMTSKSARYSSRASIHDVDVLAPPQPIKRDPPKPARKKEKSRFEPSSKTNIDTLDQAGLVKEQISEQASSLLQENHELDTPEMHKWFAQLVEGNTDNAEEDREVEQVFKPYKALPPTYHRAPVLPAGHVPALVGVNPARQGPFAVKPHVKPEMINYGNGMEIQPAPGLLNLPKFPPHDRYSVHHQVRRDARKKLQAALSTHSAAGWEWIDDVPPEESPVIHAPDTTVPRADAPLVRNVPVTGAFLRVPTPPPRVFRLTSKERRDKQLSLSMDPNVSIPEDEEIEGADVGVVTWSSPVGDLDRVDGAAFGPQQPRYNPSKKKPYTPSYVSEELRPPSTSSQHRVWVQKPNFVPDVQRQITPRIHLQRAIMRTVDPAETTGHWSQQKKIMVDGLYPEAVPVTAASSYVTQGSSHIGDHDEDSA